jgi:hypothetical protein
MDLTEHRMKRLRKTSYHSLLVYFSLCLVLDSVEFMGGVASHIHNQTRESGMGFYIVSIQRHRELRGVAKHHAELAVHCILP